MMPPASTMTNTAVDTTANKDELRKSRAPNVDFRINESTKKRIAGKAQAAGAAMAADAAMATERKSAIDAALGRYLDDSENGGVDGDDNKLSLSKGNIPGSNNTPSTLSANGIKKRASVVRRAKDEFGTSEHSTARRRRSSSRDGGVRPVSRRDREIEDRDRGSKVSLSASSEHSRNQRLRKDGLSTSEHNSNRRKDASNRVSRAGDDSGKLGSMLDQMSNGKPQKRNGARSVASMPAEPRVSKQRSNSEIMTSSSGETFGRLERMLDESLGEEDLKSEISMPVSPKERGRDLRSGRKKTERERAASPGPLIKKRSESPGPLKKRTASPGSVRKRSESLGPMKKQPESLGPPLKNRSASPGPLKRRSESPGPLKKRSESPGPLKKRSQSPGALSRSRRSSNESIQKIRSERVSRPGDENGALGSMLDQVSGGAPKKKGARSVASAPVHNARKPERRPSVAMPQKQRSARKSASGEGKFAPPTRTKSVDAVDILSVTTEMGEYDWQGYRPSECGKRPSWGIDSFYT